MFKDAAELKDFISWARKEKMSRFKVGDVEVEFTGMAHIEEVERYIKNAISGVEGKTDMDEDVLFHSGV